MKVPSKSQSFGILLTLFLMVSISACRAAPLPDFGSLSLEAYPLQKPPDPDNLTFLPIGTTQETVLAKHQAERERTTVNQLYHTSGDPYPRTDSLGPGQELTAVLNLSSQEPFRQTISLLKDEEIIFSVDAGLPSPALPLQGLWSDEDHWVLEVLYTDQDIWQGRIYRDGELLNQSKAYQDMFGFQLLAGQPIYFFQQNGKTGFSYNEEEYDLPFTEILHYGCCSAAGLNPIQAENMVAFYALSGEDWFYVELGDFQFE